MKSGTGTLDESLNSHPNISMAKGKEINFFLSSHFRGADRDIYENNFEISENTQLLGEACPVYSIHGLQKGLPQKISEKFPDAKILYIVREPFKRLVSHYAHNVRVGRTSKGLYDEVINSPEYMLTSYYAYNLKQYKKYFNDVRVEFFEELVSDNSNTLTDICNWLELPPYSFETKEEHKNKRPNQLPIKDKSPIVFQFLKFFRGGSLSSVIPRAWKETIVSLMTKGKSLDSNSQEFIEESKRLQEIAQPILDEWTVELDLLTDGKASKVWIKDNVEPSNFLSESTSWKRVLEKSLIN